MIMCPSEYLTHQLQPGVGNQYLVLFILRTETETEKKRGKERKFFLGISENSRAIFNSMEKKWFVISNSDDLNPKNKKPGCVKMCKKKKSGFVLTQSFKVN